MTKRSLAISLAVASIATLAVAQSGADPAAVEARLGGEIRCIAQVHEDIGRDLAMLRSAQSQLRHPRAGSRARADAAAAVEAIERRLDERSRVLRGCAATPEPARATRTETDGAGDADPLHGRGILGTTSLSRRVRLRVAQHVDGEGELDGPTLEQALRTISHGFERCYDDYLDRHALHRGGLHLVFTAGTNGRVREVQLEAVEVGDRTFERCVLNAARAMRGAYARGGDARISAELEFGAAR